MIECKFDSCLSKKYSKGAFETDFTATQKTETKKIWQSDRNYMTTAENIMLRLARIISFESELAEELQYFVKRE